MPNVVKGRIVLFPYIENLDITKRIPLALHSSTMVCSLVEYLLGPEIDDETRY